MNQLSSLRSECHTQRLLTVGDPNMFIHRIFKSNQWICSCSLSAIRSLIVQFTVQSRCVSIPLSSLMLSSAVRISEWFCLLEHCIDGVSIELQFIETMIDVVHSKLVCVGAVKFIPPRVSHTASDHCRQSQLWPVRSSSCREGAFVCDPGCL